MHLIDLSSPVDASFWEPDEVIHKIMSPAEGARHMSDEMRQHFGIEFDVDLLPDAEFLSNDLLTLTSHTGTHIDAPAHYGTKTSYGTPRTIDELPLEWFDGPGFLLDLAPIGVGTASADYLSGQLKKIGYSPAPGDIALLRTGADTSIGTRKYFSEFVGLDASAVHFLLDFGVRVIGTDAFSLDAPFPYILDRFRATGNRELLWPAHFAGREREYCQIERLANLGALPRPSGFAVSCFPVKIVNSGAGWTRAVARIS